MQTPEPSTITNNPLKPLIFEDTANAFAYKTDEELRRARLLFGSLRYPWVASMGPWFVRWALAWRLPIKSMLDVYFFNQFCGAKTLEGTQQRSRQLYAHGVLTVLDFAVEARKSEAGYEETAAELRREIDAAKAREEIAFVALKMSGLGSLDILEKKQAGKALNQQEQQQFQAMVERLEAVCEYAASQGQSVMIDAEESWIQNEIDTLSEAMIFKYNTTRAVVYTTAQLYRHDRLAYVKNLVERAKAAGVIAAVKLVRGAYLEKENARARTLGYPTPMQPSKVATDRDFNAAGVLCVENLQHVAVCVGTHNEESCRLIAQALASSKHPNDHPHVFFAQLYGMSDHISFNLAAAGFRVGKYLPYGPLEEVLPYLFRRAEENTSIAGQSPRELSLLDTEIRRRKAASLKGR